MTTPKQVIPNLDDSGLSLNTETKRFSDRHFQSPSDDLVCSESMVFSTEGRRRDERTYVLVPSSIFGNKSRPETRFLSFVFLQVMEDVLSDTDWS